MKDTESSMYYFQQKEKKNFFFLPETNCEKTITLINNIGISREQLAWTQKKSV